MIFKVQGVCIAIKVIIFNERRDKYSFSIRCGKIKCCGNSQHYYKPFKARYWRRKVMKTMVDNVLIIIDNTVISVSPCIIKADSGR